MNRQLILKIPANNETRFENFFWENNIVLRDTLLTSLALNSHTEKFFYLWGEEGSGKSHLLQASCHQLGLQGYTCAYLPLREFIHASPEILDNLEQLTLIAIDNLEELAGNPAWEEALFHFYNKVSAQEKTRLIFSAAKPIATLGIELPDLRSRLSACLIFHLTSLDENTCLKLLRQRAQGRGLFFPDDVAQFLIRRFPRNPAKLLEIFEQLDQAAWKEQHRLTIPFVKKTLSL